jgi:hypothetical protein
MSHYIPCLIAEKIFNKVLNMNWDYVRVKNKQKEIKINKQKGNKKK